MSDDKSDFERDDESAKDETSQPRPGLRITNNISSLRAVSNLKRSNQKLSSALERLSAGLSVGDSPSVSGAAVDANEHAAVYRYDSNGQRIRMAEVDERFSAEL